MKRSNKLLIGLLAFVSAWILLHYVGVSAMVAFDINGDKKTFGNVSEFKEDNPKGVEIIEVKGFNDVRVIMGDSFYYRVYNARDKKSYSDFTQLNLLSFDGNSNRYDTIYSDDAKAPRTIIRIDTTITSYDGKLELYVTGKEALNLRHSTVQLAESYKPFDLRILLDNSNFNGPDYNLDSIFVNRLDITSFNNSSISIGSKMRCRELNVSFLDYGSFNGATVLEKGTLRYNDSTALNGEIPGYLLKNMTLIHQPFQPTTKLPADEMVNQYD